MRRLKTCNSTIRFPLWKSLVKWIVQKKSEKRSVASGCTSLESAWDELVHTGAQCEKYVCQNFWGHVDTQLHKVIIYLSPQPNHYISWWILPKETIEQIESDFSLSSSSVALTHVLLTSISNQFKLIYQELHLLPISNFTR